MPSAPIPAALPCVVRRPEQGDAPESGLVIITNEQEYVQRFCRHSSINWDRFRLVVYTEWDPLNGFETETVTRDGTDLVLVLRRTCKVTSLAPSWWQATALVSRSNERVLHVFVGEPSGPCP